MQKYLDIDVGELKPLWQILTREGWGISSSSNTIITIGPEKEQVTHWQRKDISHLSEEQQKLLPAALHFLGVFYAEDFKVLEEEGKRFLDIHPYVLSILPKRDAVSQGLKSRELAEAEIGKLRGIMFDMEAKKKVPNISEATLTLFRVAQGFETIGEARLKELVIIEHADTELKIGGETAVEILQQEAWRDGSKSKLCHAVLVAIEERDSPTGKLTWIMSDSNIVLTDPAITQEIRKLVADGADVKAAKEATDDPARRIILDAIIGARDEDLGLER